MNRLVGLNKSYSQERSYIKKYWKSITYKTTKDRGLLIGVPHPYISPSRDEFKEMLYYWDSYFIVLGLLANDKAKLAKDIADNFLYLFKRFHFVPVTNRFYHLAKSSPPFLSSLCLEIYNTTRDHGWLRHSAKIIEREYQEVWNYGYRKTKNGLNRYWDPTHYHEQAEDESGWDKTSRFLGKCLDINPIDLNSLLYKYETDLSHIYELFNERKRAFGWLARSRVRRKLINKFMWDRKRGFFFDYDFQLGQKTKVWSLAGYFPLWAGVADERQAKLLRNNLVRFERTGGLVTTDRSYLQNGKRQWDYPNGWANLHWIVIHGLSRYGYHEDAKRIAQKWITICHKVFQKTGKFWEKYDVVTGGVAADERYSTQSGFGWTNAIFIKLLSEFW